MPSTSVATASIRTLHALQPFPYRPLRMATVLASADLCALLIAVGAGFRIWRILNPAIPPLDLVMLLAPLSAIAAFAYAGLYPGIGLTPVQHVRYVWRSITFAYLVLTAAMFLNKEWRADSRGAFFLGWLLSLGLAPAGRWISAHFFAHSAWWGAPVMVIGAGETAGAVIRHLNSNPALGYRPVVCADDDRRKRACEGIPVSGSLADVESLASAYDTQYAIVAIPGMPPERLTGYLRGWSNLFPKIMILPNLGGVASLWTEPRDLGGILGLEVQHNLLNPWNQYIKRALDIVVSALGLMAVAPLLALCAVWIKKVSSGNALYRQEREGKDGGKLHVLKLRTMFPDADALLETCLAGDTEARREWNRFCKLKKDPRVLPGVGHFLRKTSLDELPQLWNVLKGEMSLVGPRPFPRYHNQRFDPEFRRLRTRVTPGLTGLWQVSARSDGNLEVQASLDSYYIRNWSLWLDLYVLFRTVRVVLTQEGSY